MYTFLLTENNELITTVKKRIMQRSKLVDNLRFLLNPTYEDIDMSDFTVMIEYLLPASRKYKTEILQKRDELYNGKLDYRVPMDTNLTAEPGEIELQLTFAKVSMDASGNTTQQVRKISTGKLMITPIAAWSDVIADEALTAIDQRLIQVDAMINAMNDMNQYLYETKADNIIMNKEEGYVQLTANGNPIGNKIGWVNSNGDGVSSFVIDENGDLIATLTSGKIINAGHVVGKDGVDGKDGVNGVTFVPHVSDDYILSWTNDGGLENPAPVDIFPANNWQNLDEENESFYIWEQL